MQMLLTALVTLLWLLCCRRPIFMAVVLSLMTAASGSANASEKNCDEANVHIDLREEGRIDFICQAAAKAISFMASIGVKRQADIQINVVSVIPGGFDHSFGSYDWRSDEVYVRGSNACINNESRADLFSFECNEAIYESFVAREVALAIAATNFRYEGPSFTTQEYIAATVQFSVMNARQREGILGRFEGDGFDTHSEISLLSLQIDPARFAVEAYRHFMKEDNGRKFIDDLLSGAVKLWDQIAY